MCASIEMQWTASPSYRNALRCKLLSERLVCRVSQYLPRSCSTSPEEGGETVFPKAAQKVEGPEWSDCAKGVS